MSIKAFTVDDLARELGRKREWVLENWRDLVAAKKLPPPIVDSGSPTWDAAQVYAFRDRPLTKEQRATAAAFRAALDAAHVDPAGMLLDDEIARDRDELNARFARAP